MWSKYVRGVAQSGLAHLPWEQGVGGSNPLAPTSLNQPDHKHPNGQVIRFEGERR